MVLTENALRQFTGTETWYQHGLVRNVSYTEGVKYLADVGGAYWLLDKIATLQLVPEINDEPFQSWKLDVADRKATLCCEDGDHNVVHSERIAFTDFPLSHIEIWCENGVIYLPSEH